MSAHVNEPHLKKCYTREGGGVEGGREGEVERRGVEEERGLRWKEGEVERRGVEGGRV